MFLLQTGVTATLSDDDLELADYAIGRALSSDVAIVCDGDTIRTPISVYDRLEDLRRIVTSATRGRLANRPVESTSPIGPQTVPPGDGGARVSRVDTPIVRPPSPAHATVDIAF